MKESYLTSKPGEQVDNYEVTCEKWRKIFLEMDQEELISRFELEQDEQALYIMYYNERYRLDRKNGMISLVADPDRRLAFNTLMAIYHIFYYSKPWAKAKGELVPYRQVKRAAPFAPAFQRTVVDVLAKMFNGHADLLDKACISLQGERMKQGDVGYEIKAFPYISVAVVFWDGDDEFDAQANILFDANITDFLHEETVCCVGADLVRRLAEEAGLGEAEHLLGGDIVIE